MGPSVKIYVAGHRGLVGSACVRALERAGYKNILTRTRTELNLFDLEAVRQFFLHEKPEFIIDAAARVGGIIANNTYPVEFLLDNLLIQNNLIRSAYEARVKKLLFLGSSCIYPKMAPQPIPESALLTGPLEPTNSAYAIAKIAGIQLCQAYAQQYGACFISGMPTNLYGVNDNFHPENSHVLPALIRRFHEAKVAGSPKVVCWGTGAPRRELLISDDCAEACIFLLERYSSPEIINIGSGEDRSIREIAETVASVIGYEGEIVWDTARPDGTPRKVLDPSKINSLGWKAQVGLREGIALTYKWWQGQTTHSSR